MNNRKQIFQNLRLYTINKRVFVFILLFLFGFDQNAFGEMTGTKGIEKFCKSNETSIQFICTVYVRGMLDFQAIIIAENAGSKYFCPPNRRITSEELRYIFIDFVDANPNTRGAEASFTTFFALMDAYPCR